MCVRCNRHVEQVVYEQANEIQQRYQPTFEKFQAEMEKLEEELGLAKMQEELDAIRIKERWVMAALIDLK